jgi:Na+-transporting NADH:ubiquinone oxidoreductase subunit NqrA
MKKFLFTLANTHRGLREQINTSGTALNIKRGGRRYLSEIIIHAKIAESVGEC